MRGTSGAECARFGVHDVSFPPTNLRGEQNSSPWLGCLESESQELKIGPVALRQRLDRRQSCAYYPQESRKKRPHKAKRDCLAIFRITIMESIPLPNVSNRSWSSRCVIDEQVTAASDAGSACAVVGKDLLHLCDKICATRLCAGAVNFMLSGAFRFR